MQGPAPREAVGRAAGVAGNVGQCGPGLPVRSGHGVAQAFAPIAGSDPKAARQRAAPRLGRGRPADQARHGEGVGRKARRRRRCLAGLAVGGPGAAHDGQQWQKDRGESRQARTDGSHGASARSKQVSGLSAARRLSTTRTRHIHHPMDAATDGTLRAQHVARRWSRRPDARALRHRRAPSPVPSPRPCSKMPNNPRKNPGVSAANGFTVTVGSASGPCTR